MADKDPVQRRDFLKLAGTAAPAAALVVAGTAPSAQAAEPDLSSDRLQDTAHVRAYYETARF